MLRTPLIALVLFLAPLSASAVTVSGFVRDEFGFGIANVDLDFFDRDTGQIIFTPFDDTDATGFYSSTFRRPATTSRSMRTTRRSWSGKSGTWTSRGR